MSTVFYMVEQFDSMVVRDHFPICRNFCVGIFFGIFRWIFCVTILWNFLLDFFVLLYFGIFVWDFLWRGCFIWFPLHMTMVWYLAMGSGNPGTK